MSLRRTYRNANRAMNYGLPRRPERGPAHPTFGKTDPPGVSWTFYERPFGTDHETCDVCVRMRRLLHGVKA